MLKNTNSNLIMEHSFIEKIKEKAKQSSDGYCEESIGGVKVCRLLVEQEHEEGQYACPKGRYVTLYTPILYQLEEFQKNQISEIVAKELERVLLATLKLTSLKGKTVLLAGIGNRDISSDAIGALTCEKIEVTRHISIVAPRKFSDLQLCSVCAVSCGVFGQTGIETLEFLCGVSEKIQPDVIVAVDALAAKSADRLGATVQISDAGISPGAGIGNRQSAISRKTLGVPVIAIGVPTVISAYTLICDALKGYCTDDEILKITDRQKNFFVAPKECDLLSRAAADILSRAMNKIFCGI